MAEFPVSNRTPSQGPDSSPIEKAPCSDQGASKAKRPPAGDPNPASFPRMMPKSLIFQAFWPFPENTARRGPIPLLEVLNPSPISKLASNRPVLFPSLDVINNSAKGKWMGSLKKRKRPRRTANSASEGTGCQPDSDFTLVDLANAFSLSF